MAKTLVIGLDSVPPRLIYGDLEGELPNIGSIADSRGLLVSSHPPITIPAWMVMMTGKTPGELGIYGFRHRRRGTYDSVYIADSRSVREEKVWDKAGRLGKRSIVIGVPPSFPPSPIRGYMVSCFITPGRHKRYTWPPSLRSEIESVTGGYVFDIVYRSEDKDRVRKELWRLAEVQFKAAAYMAKNKKWDFMVFMFIGTDRVHHAFWKYYDSSHPRYPGRGNRYEDVIPSYYKLVDSLVGRLVEAAGKDTDIIIVSDHGAKAMEGAFAINQWLEENGYLRLKKRPEKPGTDLRGDMIDWSKTLAWAWGGYYSRVFINLKGREPHGIVDPGEYEALVEELKREITRINGPGGEHWRNMVYTPKELYPEVRGDAPDLIVYLDDLNWRPAGTIGWPSPYLEENDRGPDDAVHDWTGVIASNNKDLVVDGFRYGIESVRRLVLEKALDTG